MIDQAKLVAEIDRAKDRQVACEEAGDAAGAEAWHGYTRALRWVEAQGDAASRMTPLIFLDIDGVLNGYDWDALAESNRIDRVKVAILNRVLIATGAKIVLSSAWRYLANRDEMTFAGLDWLFRSHGVMAKALVGITHPDTPIEWDEDRGIPVRFVENERALQVRRYRAKSKHSGRYVVIDDLDLGFSAAGHPFVQTDGKVGLTNDHADRAIAILNGSRP